MISAIILAAGLSSRMGNNKLLLPLGNQTVIEHVVETVSKCHVDEIIVVLGRDAKDVTAVLERFKIRVVFNPEYIDGQSTSVKAGIKVVNRHTDGALFFMGDQPMIKFDLVNEIIDKFYHSESSIVVPTYNSKRGNPVLFACHWFTALNRIQGDKGGRDILNKNLDQVQFIDIADEMFFKDVDTETMYKDIVLNMNHIK